MRGESAAQVLATHEYWKQTARHRPDYTEAMSVVRNRGYHKRYSTTPRRPLTRRVQIRISKVLSKILRHDAIKLGLHVSTDGYCNLREVLKIACGVDPELSKKGIGVHEVREVVQGSNKQRFELNTESRIEYIRATQGHSMKGIDEGLIHRCLSVEDADLPSVCVHGTYWKYFDSIKWNGLWAGGTQKGCTRTHVHFVPFNPGDRRIVSGMRKDCEVAIWIDLRKALKDGIPFYESANKVILSSGITGRIDTDYFIKAKDLINNVDVPLTTRLAAR